MTYHKFSDQERAERERLLEQLLAKATDGEEPLQRALSIIRIMRDALDEDEEWVIEVEGYTMRYRVMRKEPQ